METLKHLDWTQIITSLFSLLGVIITFILREKYLIRNIKKDLNEIKIKLNIYQNDEQFRKAFQKATNIYMHRCGNDNSKKAIIHCVYETISNILDQFLRLEFYDLTAADTIKNIISSLSTNLKIQCKLKTEFGSDIKLFIVDINKILLELKNNKKEKVIERYYRLYISLLNRIVK